MYLKANSHTKNIILIFIITLLILLFRRFDAFANAQFWTEDSSIFFQQSINYGGGAVFKPYNGYLHLVPRLIACLFNALRVSYLYIPLCYNLSVFAVTFFVSVSLYFGAVKLQLKNTLLYATFFLFVPMGAEVFMNVTHVIWIIAIYIINYLYVSYHTDQDTDKPAMRAYLSYLVLFVFCLSGTSSLVVSPVVVLIFIAERKRMTLKKAIPLLIILACGTTQFVLLKFIDVRKPYGYWTAHAVFTRYSLELFTNNVSDIFFLYLLAPVLKYKFIFALSLVLLAVLTYLYYRSYKNIQEERKYAIVLAGLLFLVSSLTVMGKDLGPSMKGFTAMHNDPVKWVNLEGWSTYQRYLFIPYVCICWIFVLGWDHLIRLKHLLIYCCIMSFHYRDLQNNLPDLHWQQQVREYYNGGNDTIYTNPSPKQWGFRVILPPVNKTQNSSNLQPK